MNGLVERGLMCTNHHNLNTIFHILRNQGTSHKYAVNQVAVMG